MKEIIIPGNKLLIGHSALKNAQTGCTAFIFPDGAGAAVDVAGGAPGTHETDALKPGNLIQKIHGLVFTGGSAYGLSTVAGVMQFLKEKNIGFDAGGFIVPIVPAAVIFDLPLNNGLYPEKEQGYEAARNAVPKTTMGKVGAGSGATVGKIRGYDFCSPGGFGAFLQNISRNIWIAAFAVVNALGDIYDSSTGNILAGAKDEKGKFVNTSKMMISGKWDAPMQSNNTTLIHVCTNVRLNKDQCLRMARMAQDGLARAIRPAHTLYDGDVVFATSTEEVDENLDISVLGEVAAFCTEEAIKNAVDCAKY